MVKLESDYKGKPCALYEGIIDSSESAGIENSGEILSAKTIPVSVYIFEEEIAYGINPYEEIERRRAICAKTKNGTEFSFLEIVMVQLGIALLLRVQLDSTNFHHTGRKWLIPPRYRVSGHTIDLSKPKRYISSITTTPYRTSSISITIHMSNEE